MPVDPLIYLQQVQAHALFCHIHSQFSTLIHSNLCHEDIVRPTPLLMELGQVSGGQTLQLLPLLQQLHFLAPLGSRD